ncbi:MAG TPA: ABC transporter ATP-binding protein, partial [Acidimicrobiales bacterium]|nr:ABC transporter ATP-binding protein [Acidimicrobiales bacterium]
MPILEVNDLSTDIKLSRTVVHPVGNVSFSLEAGETLGIVGESGCGKSMTGLSIMRLLPNGGRVTSGSILLDGEDLVKMSDQQIRRIRGNDVAMIFQDSLTSLNPTMTIGDQIAEPVRLHRQVSKAVALDRAAEMLGLVGFPRPKEQLTTYPHQLSGGQRQRVMIAIALSCDPKVLIADEPTTALDVTIQSQILALLDDLKARLGMAVLLITHDMGVVAGRADRVNVMYAGRIVETADTTPLFTHMHHPYTQSLLGSIPKLTQDPALELFSIPGIPPDLTDPPPGCRFSPRCSRATDQCRTEEPPLTAHDGEHGFACWHPVDGPVEMVRTPAGRATPVTITAAPAAAPPSDVLVVDGVVREYPITSGMILQRQTASVKAVSGVSFSVPSGTTFGLVGESGCGKTTLGKIIVGLEVPDAGRTVFEGADIASLGTHAFRRFRRDLQMMFQDPIGSLDPRMRVGAILREPMAIQGMGNRKSQDKVVRDLLVEVGLPTNSVERFPHEFSGGQRQRIGLARALTLNPKLIVADEPVSALDVSIRSQVLNLMKRLQKTHGTTYVVISHDLAVVKYMSDRIGVMYLGKLVETGPTEDVYERAVHHYTAGLIATIPEPDPDRERVKTAAAITGELPSAVFPPSGCRFRTRCPAAGDVCAAEEPPLRPFGPGHFAACHFPLRP